MSNSGEIHLSAVNEAWNTPSEGPADLLVAPSALVELGVDEGDKRLHRPQRLLDLQLPRLAVLHRVVSDEAMDAHDRELICNLTGELLVNGCPWP